MGSSFFWATQLLPVTRREAIYAVYAYCRELEDIADSEASPSQKHAFLSDWRNQIASLYAGQPEIAFTTPINRVSASQTIGRIQPGVIWAGQYFQIGAEAILPATRLTGHGYGGVVQFHVYLDDLFPHSIGRPISEWW
jgi:phytoene/squalene synthetase